MWFEQMMVLSVVVAGGCTLAVMSLNTELTTWRSGPLDSSFSVDMSETVLSSVEQSLERM